jgi:hypothetical protein
LIDVVGVARRTDRQPAASVVDQEVVPGVAGFVGILGAVAVAVLVGLHVVELDHALDRGEHPLTEVVRSRDVGLGQRARRGIVGRLDGQQSEDDRGDDEEDDDDDRARPIGKEIRTATRGEQADQPISAIGECTRTRDQPVEHEIPPRGAA